VSTGEVIEVVVALAILVAGVVVYRRGGTQGGVILIVIGLIVAIHGFGLMDYRPSASELGR